MGFVYPVVFVCLLFLSSVAGRSVISAETRRVFILYLRLEHKIGLVSSAKCKLHSELRDSFVDVPEIRSDAFR